MILKLMVYVRCLLSLMLIGLCEVLSEFDVHWFVWDVDLVRCSLVCVRCWLSLMFNGLIEVLIEFDVHWFVLGVEWVWC